MSSLDRMKKLSGILNEDYQYDMSDKGDMHDALGDVQISIDGAMQGLQKASNLASQVSDEIEKTLYTDESVEGLDILKRNAGISEDAPQMVQVKVINSGYGTDRGMMDAEIISQELDGNMQPILKVRIKDVNMGDPVIAEWRNNMWTVDMD